MRTLDPTTLSMTELEEFCRASVAAAGGSEALAVSLARATVAAERHGKPDVGAALLVDFLDALRDGRLVGDAQPVVERSRGSVVLADARGGAAQLAFDEAFEPLVAAARASGVAILSLREAYPLGELGFSARRLADEGLVAIVCGNSPALMSVFGARSAIAGTNPMAFAVPHDEGPRSFDQASSATAWVSVRAAAARGEAIPDGWAIDAQGEPTTDAAAGLAGAMLPFGGAKGANVAVMIEVLAMLSGGMPSVDAASFDSGSESPRLGLFVLAIDPTAFDADYAERVETHLAALARDHGADFGRRHAPLEAVQLDPDVLERLRAGAGAAA